MNKAFTMVALCVGFAFGCGTEDAQEAVQRAQLSDNWGTIQFDMPDQYKGRLPTLNQLHPSNSIIDEPNSGRYKDGLNPAAVTEAKPGLTAIQAPSRSRTASPVPVEVGQNQHLQDLEPQAPCYALAFAGQTRGYIEDSAAMNLRFSTGTTIEAWVRIDNDSGTLLSKKGDMDDPLWTVSYGDGMLYFTAGSTDSAASIFAAEYPASEWFHVAIVRGADVEEEVIIFIDGVPSSDVVQLGKDMEDVESDYPVLIGVDNVDADITFRGALGRLHIANGVQYTEAFEPRINLRPTAATIGLWHFTHVANAAVRNAYQKDHFVHIDGPIAGEHATLCD
ncbi:MAG: LamG-like jellyroll fold domain-containing protein [Myxococcota bacterium]|nr:LamG-like jellyroll fold domain-containing protein [Myxococcota bacterium]